MTMEILGPDPSEDKVLRMYRILAQTDMATISALTSVATTHAQIKADAEFTVNMPTNPFVIRDICTKEEWNRGTINFCPRCGHKLDAPMENSQARLTAIDCDECGATSEVSIVDYVPLQEPPADNT